MPLPILPTTLVGSFPQPDWLIDREKLSKQVPRVNANLWLPKPSELELKQDQATVEAIRDQESVGSTSLPTASSAAKAIRAASPTHSRVSIRSTTEPRSTGWASRSRCRA